MTLPRVTEVLNAFSGFVHVPTDILENAAVRGTKVHSYCAAIASKAWMPESMIEEELKGYIKSFELWASAQVNDFIIVEKRYQDETLGYTGQIDYVIIGSDDQLYLVDIKTSAKPQKTYRIQMSAYAHLLKKHDMKVNAAMIVYLDKTGEFPNIELIDTLEEDFEVFVSALTCYKFFNKDRKYARKRKPTAKAA